MEHGTTTPLDSKLKTALLDNTGDTAQTELRLAALIAANAETDRRNKLYPTLAVEAEVAAMRRPLTPEDAFAYFGLMIGLLVPASMFIAFALASSGYTEWIVYTLTTLTTITTTVAGYLFGKVVGRSVDKIASRPGHIRFMLLLLIGARSIHLYHRGVFRCSTRRYCRIDRVAGLRPAVLCRPKGRYDRHPPFSPARVRSDVGHLLAGLRRILPLVDGLDFAFVLRRFTI